LIAGLAHTSPEGDRLSRRAARPQRKPGEKAISASSTPPPPPPPPRAKRLRASRWSKGAVEVAAAIEQARFNAELLFKLCLEGLRTLVFLFFCFFVGFFVFFLVVCFFFVFFFDVERPAIGRIRRRRLEEYGNSSFVPVTRSPASGCEPEVPEVQLPPRHGGRSSRRFRHQRPFRPAPARAGPSWVWPTRKSVEAATL